LHRLGHYLWLRILASVSAKRDCLAVRELPLSCERANADVDSPAFFAFFFKAPGRLIAFWMKLSDGPVFI
jgi:hypothetical protein